MEVAPRGDHPRLRVTDEIIDGRHRPSRWLDPAAASTAVLTRSAQMPHRGVGTAEAMEPVSSMAHPSRLLLAGMSIAAALIAGCTRRPETVIILGQAWPEASSAEAGAGMSLPRWLLPPAFHPGGDLHELDEHEKGPHGGGPPAADDEEIEEGPAGDAPYFERRKGYEEDI
jgi:hypothetical protein